MRDDIEQQWDALNGDQTASNGDNLLLTERQILQREQDHFGFIVIGSPFEQGRPGDVIHGIHIGMAGEEAPDITLRVIGESSLEEWGAHALFNFGPTALAEFNFCAAGFEYIVRAIAE